MSDGWKPTCVLRTIPGCHLQQQWRRMLIGPLGQFAGYDYEWRAIPHDPSGKKEDES